MRSLILFAALLSMTTLAAPALAVTPQQGDIFHFVDAGLIHLEASSGIETLVSCSDLIHCNPLIGSGPPIGAFQLSNPQVGPDGWIYFFNTASTAGTEGFHRIDPNNGNREFLVTPSQAASFGFAVWPAPNFFPATVASIGGWGLAALVAGIFIGVQLKIRRTAEA